MLRQLRPALVILGALTLLTGVVYPLAVTGVARAAFPRQAEGSLVVPGSGSSLIGQSFDDPKYVWGRLSATTPAYNASASAGSNLGPTNEALTKAAQARIDALRAADPSNTAKIPVDLVTASASGLDPDISPAAAEYQVPRVARARRVDEAKIHALVAANTSGRDLGVLGEPRVHVAPLNVALDAMR